VVSTHGLARRKPDPDGITTAQLAGTVGRYVSRKPLDVDAAVAELREIAGAAVILHDKRPFVGRSRA
jgi:hypothetical protein